MPDIDDELQKLQVEFDMNEFGDVAENGHYLMKRVRQIVQQEKLKAQIEELKQLRKRKDDTGDTYYTLIIGREVELQSQLTKLNGQEGEK